MIKGLKQLIALGFVVLFFSCQRMERCDLPGIYKAIYLDKVQILVLKQDGTYEELFVYARRPYLEKYVGKWEFRKNFWSTGLLKHTVILHGGIDIEYDQGRADTTVVTGAQFLDPMTTLLSRRIYFEVGDGVYLTKQ